MVTCLLIILLLVGVHAQSVTLPGAGTSKFSEITTLYSSVVNNQVQLPYTQTSLSQAKIQFSLSRIDYIITQTPLFPSEHTQSECSGVYDVREFPLNVDGLIIIYTIPGVDSQDPSTPTLILDRQLIVDIYSGVVTKWNDERIATLNPSLASVLPDASFTPYYIADSSLSQVFSNALSSFNSTWKEAQEMVGPTGWPYQATPILNEEGNAPDRMLSQVLASSSFGFVQYSVSTSLKNIARIINRAGTTMTITKGSLTSATNDFLGNLLPFINKTNADPYIYPASALLIVDGEGINSWPFAHFNFFVTRTNSMQDCLKTSSMFSLLNWMLLGPRVAQVWESNPGLALVQGIILSSLSSNIVSKMSCCQTVGGGGVSKSPLIGQGTAFSSSSLYQLATLFNALNYQATITYSLLSSPFDPFDKVIDGSIDFAFTSSPPPLSSSSLHSFPLIGASVVCIYNVAGVSDLALTLPQMVAIFTKEITNWQQINNNYPNQIINVILNADPDVASVFLNSILNPPVSFVSGTQEETIKSVNDTSFSIGVVALTSDVAELRVANFINDAGQVIIATNLTALQSHFASNSSTGWPLSSYSYVTFKAEAGSFCPPLVNLAQFIYWTYTDPSASNSLISAFSVRPPNLADYIGSSLNQISCGGHPLLIPRLVVPGAGSTFAAGVYQAWLTSYAYVDGEVEFTYTGTGSGAGISSIIQRNVLWAGTDAPLTTQQSSDGGDLQLYPVFAGSVVLAYRIDALNENSPSPPSLNFTREVVVDIYRGVITKWNDPRILDINPEVASILPDANIVLVYRSDSSGTTNIFTKALNAFNPSIWTATGTRIEWPIPGITGEGSSGVGLRIFSTANSLGYVELSYAIANGLSYANFRNKAGKWVSASVATSQSAMQDYINSFAPDFTCSIVDGPGGNSWPLAAYTYLALHTSSMNDFNTALKLLEFIVWGVTSNVASARVSDLGFAPLSGKFVEDRLIPKLREVRVNGVSVLGEMKESDSDRLALGLGVGLGVGVPLLIIIALLLLYTRHVKRRRRNLQDGFSIEAPEWADEGIELQLYNDTFGLKLNNGQEIFRFGIPKGSRFPVMQTLIERITITNDSSTDRNFAFFVPRDDIRFKMVIFPGYGALKPGEETSVEVRFTLLMTTAIERKVKFEVLGCGEQGIPLKVAGDVSTRLDPNEIDILGKPIGQGAFGTVYRGTYRGTQVAVKVLARQNELLKAQTDEFLKEIDLMHKLRSPFIVGFIGASYVPGKLCVLTEFMEKGSVASMLRKIKLDHHHRLKVALDCANAMAFLHNNGVIHRDLKPANLLVVSLSSSAEVTVKLADFGTSRTVTQINANAFYTNGWGTPGYMAPELLARGEYSGKVDVYAFGILLLELFTQKDPFGFMKKMWDLPDFIIGGNRPDIPVDCPSDYSALISQCWSQIPSDRPSFPDLIVILEPMYNAEKMRAKETKRRMVEAGLTPIKSSGSGYEGYPTSSNSNNLSNTNISNTLSNNLTNTNDPMYSNLSMGPDTQERNNSPAFKKTNLTNDITSLANLSTDNISKDRKKYFTENKDDL